LSLDIATAYINYIEPGQNTESRPDRLASCSYQNECALNTRFLPTFSAEGAACLATFSHIV